MEDLIVCRVRQMLTNLGYVRLESPGFTYEKDGHVAYVWCNHKARTVSACIDLTLLTLETRVGKDACEDTFYEFVKMNS